MRDNPSNRWVPVALKKKQFNHSRGSLLHICYLGSHASHNASLMVTLQEAFTQKLKFMRYSRPYPLFLGSRNASTVRDKITLTMYTKQCSVLICDQNFLILILYLLVPALPPWPHKASSVVAAWTLAVHLNSVEWLALCLLHHGVLSGVSYWPAAERHLHSVQLQLQQPWVAGRDHSQETGSVLR